MEKVIAIRLPETIPHTQAKMSREVRSVLVPGKVFAAVMPVRILAESRRGVPKTEVQSVLQIKGITHQKVRIIPEQSANTVLQNVR